MADNDGKNFTRSIVEAGAGLLGLLRLMTGFRLIYIAATITLGLGALARTGIYLWLRYFIDTILVNMTTLQALFMPVATLLGLALMQASFIFVSGALAARTAENIARRLRNLMFDHVQRLSFRYHDHTPTGELIQRSTSDVEAIRRFFADQVIGAGRILLLFIVNFTAIASLNARLAFLSIIVVPPVVALSIYFFRRVSKAYEAYQEQEAFLSTALQENLTGVRVVKAFARQAHEIEKFERENWEKFLRGKHLLTMHSVYWPTSDLLSAFQMLFGMALGARMAIEGTISVGTYIAYAGMIIWIIWPMRNLGRLIVQMSTGLVSFRRVIKVLQEDQEPMSTGSVEAGEDLRGEIIFKDVCFAYDQDNIVLEDINLRCEPGQSIALLGATGSGKTTLVNLIPRFYEYTSGSLTLDGIELDKYTRETLRSRIGIVEQEPFLFSRSIRENITFGVSRPVTDEEVEQAATAAAIAESIHSFPNGYDTLVGEKGVTLSGGQKQRIAIARALLKDPRILILDDSTSSVDIETESQIRDALDRLMEGRTTFIIAHRIQSVMNADLILVLEKGRVVQRGVHHELLQSEGPYHRIHEIQTRIEDTLKAELASVDD